MKKKKLSSDGRPEGKVLWVRGLTAGVLCPFCGDVHQHRGVEPGVRQFRAAGCNLAFKITPEVRLNGYHFITWFGEGR